MNLEQARYSSGDVTQLLQDWQQGSPNALEDLFSCVYQVLRSLARRQLHTRWMGITLQPTDLIHEAYLKLRIGEGRPCINRAQFYSLVARVMRHILIDRSRGRNAIRRGGEWDRIFDADSEFIDVAPDRTESLLLVDELLSELEKFDPRKGQIVELRFFAGLTIKETAEALDLSEITVVREWRAARAWLNERFQSGSAES